MRDIILGRKGANTVRARRAEKRMVEACQHRILEEIAPEDKTRNEVLGARVGIYMAAKKWRIPCGRPS